METTKEIAQRLMDKFLPYVDYVEDGILSETETMHKNAKMCAVLCVNEIIKELDDIERAESGLVSGCVGQYNWVNVIKEIRNLD